MMRRKGRPVDFDFDLGEARRKRPTGSGPTNPWTGRSGGGRVANPWTGR
jgi:hypothetical protein